MRAVVCRAFGDPLALGVAEVPKPEPAAGEARVRVEAAGVNFADRLMVEGRYQIKPPLPFVPGSEFCGVIDALGPDVKGWAVGDRVMGASVSGGFCAEFGVVPVKRIVRWPETMDTGVAAGIFIGHGTAWFGLVRRGGLVAGETVLVTGAGGGLGTPTIEVARRVGARVIAAAGSAEKLAQAKRAGADAVIDYRDQDLKEAVLGLTEGRGYDLLFDAVGGDVFDQAIRAAAPFARLLVVGFAGGRIQQVPANRLLLRNISVIGVGGHVVTLGAGDELNRQMRALEEMHAALPFRSAVTAEYPLEQAGEALKRLAERQAVGKLLIRPNGVPALAAAGAREQVVDQAHPGGLGHRAPVVLGDHLGAGGLA
jgi:NADPH2:quinone reductase